MANGKPNRPIRPRGGGPKGRRRVVIDQGGGRPGQGQRQRPGDRPADRGPRQPREVVAPTGPAHAHHRHVEDDPNGGVPIETVAPADEESR